ncbi:hypothetical protein HOY80DRAFT_854270, partial [Tuber brumale]
MLSSTEQTLVKDRKKDQLSKKKRAYLLIISHCMHSLSTILGLTQNRTAPPFTLQYFPVAKALVPSFETPSPAQSRKIFEARSL